MLKLKEAKKKMKKRRKRRGKEIRNKKDLAHFTI